MSESKSYLLTEETVPAYLIKRCGELGFFSNDSKLTAKAILGGNVNYAFRVVEDGTGRMVFVKQAPEFVAIFGPDGYPLSSGRMQKEVDVFNEWREILGPELSAKYLPTIHLFDREMMVFVMEFFDGYTLLDHDIVDTGVISNDIAIGLGEFMGKTHAATHTSKVSEQRAEALKTNYENREMRDVQLEFVFTKCYKEVSDEQRAGLNIDEAFMKEVEMLKSAYDGNTENLVLCHGDLHPGSVMVKNESGDVKVIDPEFTIYGPPGLDVGSMLSGYILGAVHQVYSNNAKAVASLCDGAEAIWESYKKEMIAGGISEEIVTEIEIESVGYTVAEVCRTALEFAGGRKWLQFDDKKVKDDAKKAALKIVENCMIKRHDGKMNLLLSEIKALADA